MFLIVPATTRAKYLDGVLVEHEGPVPPSFDLVLDKVQAFCRGHPEILRLEASGSVADGKASIGSDVDLLATFAPHLLPRGLAYFGHLENLEQELTSILCVPIDLHDRASVDRSDNLYRRESILRSVRLLYSAQPPEICF